MTRSDKTSLIAQKYTHAYNGIYLLFCRCYSNSVSFIELLRILAILASYMVKFVLKYCVQKKELYIKLERLKNFMAIRLVLSDRVHILQYCPTLIPMDFNGRYRTTNRLRSNRGVANDPEISYTFHEIRQEIHRNTEI